VGDLAPTGATGLAADYLRTLLSENSAFQTWTGHAGSASAALEHVYDGIVTTEPENVPYVLIEDAIEAQPADEKIAETFVGTVELELLIGNDVPEAYVNSGRNAAVFVRNEFDALRAILWALNGGEVDGVRIYIQSVQCRERPWFIRRSAQSGTDRFECYQMRFGLTFGPHGE